MDSSETKNYISVITDKGEKKIFHPLRQRRLDTDTGKWEVVELTDDEKLQHCLGRLISITREEEFEKNLISLVSNYFSDIDDWSTIKLELSFPSGRSIIHNLRNPDIVRYVGLDGEIKQSHKLSGIESTFTHDIIEKIRNSSGDAEARRHIGQHIKQQINGQ